ncbi:MAG: hypothetical protein ACKO8L_05795, partial [Flavobacterium sp.]
LVFLGGLMASDDAANSSWITPLIYLSYVILIACIALVLIYVFKNLFSKKEDLKKTFIIIGLFIGVLLISYILSDGSEVRSVSNEVIATESTSKWVGTGILLTTILAIVAILSVFWSGFNKIKK